MGERVVGSPLASADPLTYSWTADRRADVTLDRCSTTGADFTGSDGRRVERIWHPSVLTITVRTQFSHQIRFNLVRTQ